MKSSVDIILSKLTNIVIPEDIIFKIENHIYFWIHLLKQPSIHKELLYVLYKKEFPKGTPVICACELGRLNDLKIFIAGTDNINVKKMLETVGSDCNGWEKNTLMAAAMYEKPEILLHLLNYDINTAIINRYENNALHCSAWSVRSTRCIELLLNKMSLEAINKKNWEGTTPLAMAYGNYISPVQNKSINLIRQYGGTT